MGSVSLYDYHDEAEKSEIMSTPNRYPMILQIEVEDNSVLGLKFVYRDGDEEFYPRTEVLDLTIQSK